jgi:hypothetical protein
MASSRTAPDTRARRASSVYSGSRLKMISGAETPSPTLCTGMGIDSVTDTFSGAVERASRMASSSRRSASGLYPV